MEPNLALHDAPETLDRGVPGATRRQKEGYEVERVHLPQTEDRVLARMVVKDEVDGKSSAFLDGLAQRRQEVK